MFNFLRFETTHYVWMIHFETARTRFISESGSSNIQTSSTSLRSMVNGQSLRPHTNVLQGFVDKTASIVNNSFMTDAVLFAIFAATFQ